MMVDGRDQCSLIVRVRVSNRRSSCFNIDLIISRVGLSLILPIARLSSFASLKLITRELAQRQEKLIGHLSDFYTCSSLPLFSLLIE